MSFAKVDRRVSPVLRLCWLRLNREAFLHHEQTLGAGNSGDFTKLLEKIRISIGLQLRMEFVAVNSCFGKRSRIDFEAQSHPVPHCITVKTYRQNFRYLDATLVDSREICDVYTIPFMFSYRSCGAHKLKS